MRLCKDCWYCWLERGICCHEKSQRDFITGKCIGTIESMRSKASLGECEESGRLWRPKRFSPNKIYKFQILCPDCKQYDLYELYNNDSGKRSCSCSYCKRDIWLPFYGENKPIKTGTPMQRFIIEEWKNIGSECK
jgi:hypothetical protein